MEDILCQALSDVSQDKIDDIKHLIIFKDGSQDLDRLPDAEELISLVSLCSIDLLLILPVKVVFVSL